MHKVIANAKALEDWLENKEHEHTSEVIISSGAITYIRDQVQIMDSCYGEARDIERDLGGYMILLYGKDDEVQKEHEKILHYHHLQDNQYEYKEHYKAIIGNESIKIRLYLCSSDYGIILVSITES